MSLKINTDYRIVRLEGVSNFRDLGGYKTKDGRRVKKGLLFRSADLTNMTDKDKAVLQSLKIKYFFDFRDVQEANIRPDPMIEGIKYERVAANNYVQEAPTNYTIEDVAHTYKEFNGDTLKKMYASMTVQNPAYKRLLEIIQEPTNLGLVQHCAVGKDRTGIGSALILLALDVPKETIIEDYLLSNEQLKSLHEVILAKLDGINDPVILQTAKDLLTAKEEYIESFFTAISKNYRDSSAYLLQEYNLDIGKREKLMELYLE